MNTGSAIKRSLIPLRLVLCVMPPPLGAELIVSGIEIRGNDYTDAGIIVNYLYVSEGDVLDDRRLDYLMRKSRRRLLDTQYFSRVSVASEPSGEDSVRVVVTVKEGFLWRVSLGFWFVGFGRDNLLGKGLNGSVHLSLDSQSLSFDNPYFRGTPFRLGAGVNHHISGHDIVPIDTSEDFEYERYGLMFSTGYNFNPDLSFTLSTSLHSFELFEEEFDGEARDFLGDHGVLGRTRDTDISLTGTYDNRNNRLTPSGGYLISGTYSHRSGAPGVGIQMLEYLPMTGRAYLFLRFAWRSFDDALPYHLWPGLGGFNGLKFPLEEDEIGRTTAFLSVEPRYRFLYLPWYDSFVEARLFFDTGSAYLETGDFSFDRFVGGYGAGLRLWIGYPYFQNALVYYGMRGGRGELFFHFGSSF